MKKLFFIFGIITIGLMLTFEIWAQEKSPRLELTVYNQNLALVKDRRLMPFKKGLNRVSLKEVASLIDPTSVHFKSISDPEACSIREQNYEYDLLSGGKLLQKYVDRKIRVQTKDGKTYEGFLLSFDQGQIILGSGRESGTINLIHRNDNIQTILFPVLPEGLITKPTLAWEVMAQKAGGQTIEVSYLTEGINWQADYVAVVNNDDTKLDLSGWVSIDNRSGAAYQNAKLKLVAGEIHLAGKKPSLVFGGELKTARMGKEGFKEMPFFEYHLYSLPRLVTLKDNQIKQITLLSAPGVAVKKLYVFDMSGPYGWIIARRKKKINVKLELENRRELGLGMALPKGKVRVYKADQEGSLQFVGEDLIEHTPKDEKFRLYVGDAFDLVGERKRVKTERISKRIQDDTYEIKLRNHKDSDVEILVVEHIPGGREWRITRTTHDYINKDAYTIEFTVDVVKDRETVVTYTVRSRW
ncbi:MAG: DUF4139 domain-containing protein [Candidatus Ratteibacteria bacterium]|nr:DUF4139 domain-containing protein [Candidatus Ratteibacteria bacterium]